MTRLLAAALSVIVLATLLFLPACQFKEPVLPSWESTFRVPFEVKNFIVGEEIVNDSTIIIQPGDLDSILFLSLKDSLVNLEEISAKDLSVKLDDVNEEVGLDTLVIAALETLEIPLVALGDLLPELSGLIGLPVTIPDTTIIAPPALLNAGDFKRIHFLSGTIRLRIHNNLPVPVGPNPSAPAGLHVAVINDSLNEVFVELNFPQTIQPGQTAEAEADIQNRWLYSPLRIEYRIPIAQATTVTITNALLDTAGVAIALELENIRADEAVAVLGQQNYSEVIKLSYDGEHRLRSAEIERGQMQITFTNHTALDTDMKVKIPALRSAANDTFIAEVQLPAGGARPLFLQFDDYTISNPRFPGAFLDTLELILDAATAAQNQIIHIRSSDRIALQVLSDSLVFKAFSGFLGADSLLFDPFQADSIADYQGFDEGIELSQAYLNLKLYSEVFIQNLLANLTITGYHENEQGVITDSAAIVLQDRAFSGGHPGQPGITEIVLNDQSIVDFLNILPTSLRIEGMVKVSGEAAISRGDRIWLDYYFETPFKVRITSLASIEGEVDSLTNADVDSLLRDAAENNILDANLEFTLTNHTPLGGTIRFILTADAADTNIFDDDYDTSRVIIREVAVTPAPTNPISGFVTAPRQSAITEHLNRREIQLFSEPPLRYGYVLRVQNTPGFVTLRYADYVGIRGSAFLRVLVEDE